MNQVFAVFFTLSLVALIVLVGILLRKASVSSRAQIDFSPLIPRLEIIGHSQQESDRSMREEQLSSRREAADHSQNLRTEVSASLKSLGELLLTQVSNLSQTNDQRIETLRGGLEQRLESFGTDSAVRADHLGRGLNDSIALLQGEVGKKLDSFRATLQETVAQTHTLQHQQSSALTDTLEAFRSKLDERQSEFHQLVDTKLQQVREETGAALGRFSDSVSATLTEALHAQKAELVEIRVTMDQRLAAIQSDNEKKLEQVRLTVDEKLQGTLDARLGESFRTVSERLEQVFKGLGEMQTLATGVGDLKRMLSNVKARGTWGEVQLGGLLEQVLAPDQYERNVATTGTGERVEFAIKLPGPDGDGSPLWLPIDAKFPIEDYQRIVEASERGDAEATEFAGRQFENTIKSYAKNISDKYLAPPATTDFGILFLATEGLYAEALRRNGLAELLQQKHRIMVAGPTTLAAFLNALQMGFRTLAIQKRSSEVWEILGDVKTQFAKYASLLDKIKKKLNEATNTVEDAEKRTRVIGRKLREVGAPSESTALLVESGSR